MGKKIILSPDLKSLTKKEPEKSLLLPYKQSAGRSKGQITVRFRGGGTKKRLRKVDFGEEKINIPAKVEAIEYDPLRTAFLMLLCYRDGDRRYRLAPHGIKVGDEIICQEKAPLKIGNRLKLKYIPVGTQVFEVELTPGKGGKIVRSAGSYAQVTSKDEGYVELLLPSKEIRKVPEDCFATIGQVSNPGHQIEIIGKAGRVRLKGRKPRVRGSAMNPPDHPHGGGEGKTPIGLKHPKTPWGKPARGVKTRKRKKWSNKFIVKRRK